MSLLGTTVFQIQSTASASNVNGGGFNPANPSFLTDGVIASGTGNSATISSATYSFVSDDIGAWIYLPIQTNITIEGYFQITSVNAGTATLKSAIGEGILVIEQLYFAQLVAGVSSSASFSSVTFGVDYSQTDSARYTATDLTGATTTCTSATNPFTEQMVGNIIQLNSGTGVTAGFYEIRSVAAGTATIDRSAGATYSAVTYHTGGAFSLGSSDDAIFELAASSVTSATRYFVKGGSNITYTIGGTVSITAAGNTRSPVIFESFVSTRGDRPKGSTRPTFACGATTFTSGTAWYWYGLIFTGTASPVFSSGQSNAYINFKLTNSSTTAGRPGLTGGNPSNSFSLEAVSYRGSALNSQGHICYGGYLHDSSIGFNQNGSVAVSIINTIISSCYTNAINYNTAVATSSVFSNNTLYGAENKLGIGFNTTFSSTQFLFTNNIVYGFVTGVSNSGTSFGFVNGYNNYYNNTSDVNAAANFQKGSSSISVDPQFTNIVQRTGATATTTAGSHLLQTGATFQTWGITPGVDFLYIASGTGVTAGVYGIASVDSETQITTDVSLAANATGDKVWQITQGQNFSVGTNLKATGYPGLFPGSMTTGYLDIGAVQRQESSGGSGGSFTFS